MTFLLILFAGDSQIVNSEVQKRVMREFGFPDSLACEIFRHAPDLIEDSSSSSGSSRHSTLNKVGFIIFSLRWYLFVKFSAFLPTDASCSYLHCEKLEFTD